MNVSMRRFGATKSGLAALFLAMSLASCATIPSPPAEYLEDCPITEPKAGELTNGDVAKLAVRRAFDVERCNLDKRALRAWYEGYEARGAKRWFKRSKP